MQSLWHDLRYGWRMLGQHRGFTIVAILSLALGIGANTAIFSVVNAGFVRPLPVEQVQTLVSVFTSNVGGSRYGSTSYPDYADLRDSNEVFSGLAAQTYIRMGLRGSDRTEVVTGQLVSWNYFQVLGIEPHIGRVFLPEEDQTPGTHPVAVISYRMWRNVFGSDPEILGRTVHINDYPFTVIGVAPQEFRGLSVVLATEVWVPLHMANQALPYTPQFDGRIDPWLFLVGRLKPGVTLEQARADLDIRAANLEDEYPKLNQGKSFPAVEADHDRLGFGPVDSAVSVTAIIMGVVAIVLMIAAFNVANLHLARALARQREMALRVSLGASRVRIVRQLLTESLMLSLLAGGVGLMFAVWVQELIVFLSPEGFPLEIDLGFDTRVLGFTLLLSIVTGVFFGLTPALQTSRPDQATALRNHPSAVSQRKTTFRLQNVFVIGQIALSLVLLICAGLLLKSLHRTSAVDPGFELRNGAVASINLGFTQYPAAEGRAFQRRLQDRIAAMPGVESVAAMAFAPFGESHGHHDVEIDGYEPESDESMLFPRNMVGPDYFETMGIPVIRGRDFNERDREGSKLVALVNETMARRYWPGRNAIGGRIWADLGEEREVVGIVKDGKYRARAEEQKPYLYIPLDQAEYMQQLSFVVRTAGNPNGLIEPIRREIRRLDPNLPPASVATVDKYLDQSLFAAKGPAFLVTAFGCLALTVAIVGVYGVMSYLVSQRAHEYGIRRALGAQRREILFLVMRRGFVTTSSGIAVGLALGVAATRILAGFLYEVSPLDLGVFSLVSLALMTTALLAGFLPARAATKVHPLEVLRME